MTAADLHTEAEPALLVDAHVHFHPGFAPDTFLDAAHANFRAAYDGLSGVAGFHGFLVLTEARGRNVFRGWRDVAEGRAAPGSAADAPAGWSFQLTEEACTLRARHRSDGRTLLIVAGRQVRSRERLEVLALGTAEDLSDALPFEDLVELACSSAPLVVLPWGFGKWWLGRGRRVAATLREVRDTRCGDRLFLGDNGGRPLRTPLPRRMRERAGPARPILSGSDPLPFPDHEARAGGFGFWIEAPHDPGRPFESLASRILAGASVRSYGGPRSLAGFLRDQVRLQTRWR